ncbi:TPA: hypothetical protein QDC24_002613, partial [Burkholderia cepacia ATCC 25416]|nr:hypothetical protein [Burkholderia cepacia ATCC 25416]
MLKSKRPFRTTGRCHRATLFAAAAFACCCSYAVAQDATPDSAPDAVASADAIMMLVDDASPCAANPAACPVHVFAGGHAGGNGAGATGNGSGSSPGSGNGNGGGSGNNGNGTVGPAGVGGTTSGTSGGTSGSGGSGRGGNASGNGGSG